MCHKLFVKFFTRLSAWQAMFCQTQRIICIWWPDATGRDAFHRVPNLLYFQKRMGRGERHPYHTTPPVFRYFLLPKSLRPPHFHRMATGEGIHRDIGRQTPAAGAHIFSGQPNIFFGTVNAKYAVPWMANMTVQQSLAEIWSKEATAWLV